MSKIELIQGDCLEKMKGIPDGGIDCIITDPPYGTTACKWDTIIPFEAMWEQLKRITKKNGAIVLFGSQPFTSALVMSNPKMFKYEWVWDKATISNPMLAKYQPLKQHENIVVFSLESHNYYPQKTDLDITRTWKQSRQNSDATAPAKIGAVGVVKGKYPKTIQKFNAAKYEGNIKHPTQKPVALMEYLIKTYTNEGELVLDFTMGSGTTMVACQNLNRNGIGIELDSEYFKIAEKRINEKLVKELKDAKD